MEQITLQAQRRQVLGKKVRHLRARGLLPANVYGPGTSSLAVQVETPSATQAVRQAGASTLITLQVGREGKTRPVLVRNFQRHPITGQILHIDFYQVDLSQSVRARVDLILVGESPALQTRSAFLRQVLSSIEIEALPGDLPPEIAVDLSGLVDVDQSISAGSVSLPPGVTLLTDPDEEIVRIATGHVASGEEEHERPMESIGSPPVEPEDRSEN